MMKMPALIVALMTAALLTAAANSQDSTSRQTGSDDSSSKVKELQLQKIATLKEVVEAATAEHRNGRGSYDELIDANVQLLNAELEIASNDTERVRIHENIVKQFTGLEEVAQAAREAGRGRYTAVLKAKSRRLEAEIQLERAKGRGAK